MSDQFPGPGNPNNPPSWGQPGGAVPPPPGGFPQMGMGMPMGGDMAGMNKQATQTLIASIVGLVCCFIGSIFAIINGNKVKAQAAAAGVEEPSNNKIGRIIAIVALVLWVLGFIVQLANR
jgi:hypothetical protein